MTYNPTTWKAGDTVTSAKLNKMEQGIANGGGMMIVNVDNYGVLNKTWQEIYDAMPNVIIYGDGGPTKFSTIPFTIIPGNPDNFEIKCMEPMATTNGTFTTMTFSANSSNGYPQVQFPGTSQLSGGDPK